MANVAACSVSTKPAERAPGIIGALSGLALMGCAGVCVVACVMEGAYEGVTLAILGVASGVLMLCGGSVAVTMAKDTYTIRIGSTSGGVVALVSTDRERVGNIVDAVNEAIIRRG